MRFRRMCGAVVFLFCVGLCSCALVSKGSERLCCELTFVVDPVESPWEDSVRAVYRQARDICSEHGAVISSSSMANYHDHPTGHGVRVIVHVTTDKSARLADALLKRIRYADEAVFLQNVFICWWHKDDLENGGWGSARFVRGSQEPQVERRVQETVPLDD